MSRIVGKLEHEGVRRDDGNGVWVADARASLAHHRGGYATDEGALVCPDHGCLGSAIVLGVAAPANADAIGSEQTQTAEECGSISHGPLTRPSATLSHWERHESFEKAPWVRGQQLNKFDRSLNFFATK